MNRSPLRLTLILAVVAIGSLGATDCTDEQEQMLFDAAVEILSDHEIRLNALERCECVGVLAPVCGEDGRTYVNRCEARCTGTAIMAPGPCKDTTCGGEAGTPCETGSFCESRPGCDAMAVGMCEDIPELCPDDFAPVCGCDGNTYSNDCTRQEAGVPLDFPADCANPPVECDVNDHCASDEFCQKRPRVCDEAPGVCSVRPDVCPLDFNPVCGCDGTTYSNACAAANSGASIASRGRCEEAPVECSYNQDCPDDEFCSTLPGECSATGVCRPVPEVCPQIHEPVCGCDGNTYPNSCEARGAGISLEDDEACDTGVVLCHVPPGNPGNFHTIIVEPGDADGHLRNHDDHLGRCEDGESTEALQSSDAAVTPALQQSFQRRSGRRR
jgi:hypothetical protein